MIDRIVEYITGSFDLVQIILAAVLAVVALIAGLFLGGIIFYKKGFRNGKKKGESENRPLLAADEMPVGYKETPITAFEQPDEEQRNKAIAIQQELIKKEQIIKQQAQKLLDEKQKLAAEKEQIALMRAEIEAQAKEDAEKARLEDERRIKEEQESIIASEAEKAQLQADRKTLTDQEDEFRRIQAEEEARQLEETRKALEEEEKRRQAEEEARQLEEMQKALEEEEKRRQAELQLATLLATTHTVEEKTEEVEEPTKGGGVLDDANLEKVIAERRAKGVRIVSAEGLIKHVDSLSDPVKAKAVENENGFFRFVADEVTFGFLQERKKSIKLFLRLNEKSAKTYKAKLTAEPSLGNDWYHTYVDVNFDSRSEVYSTIDNAYYDVTESYFTNDPATDLYFIIDENKVAEQEKTISIAISSLEQDDAFIDLSDKLDITQDHAAPAFEMYNKEDIVKFANEMAGGKAKISAVYRPGIRPTSLKANTNTFAMVYEKNNVVKMVFRAPAKAYEALHKLYTYVTKAKFPKGADWYSIILDDSIKSNKEIEELIQGSYAYVSKKYSKKD